MIPRYQRILYWTLIAGMLLMFALLVRGCQRNHDRMIAMRDQSPIAAPTDIPNEQATFALANDADGSITLDAKSLALPEEPSLRARVLLDRLLTDFSLPASNHPVPAGPAVTDVFLVALPLANPGSNGFIPSTTPDAPQSVRRYDAPSPYHPHSPGAQLAVVNLTKAFADAHPSGVETEDLTLRAIITTLHSNFPQIEQVRFLVDGQARETLNGHADLSRPYSVVDPAKSIHVLSADGSNL